jgi:hypothetical protein
MIIVNFSTREYKAGQQRLSASLGKWPYLMFSNYEEIGSPSHSESPYEFKIHAIEKAFEKDDIVLWCDSSLWLVGDLSKIENIIKQDGYFMEEAGHWVGSWTNQHTRKYFNLTDEEAKVPGGFNMFSAGFLGLNLKSEIAMKFLYEWKQSALAGCFSGSWENHRHDMTCGSIIAQRLGMKYQRGGEHMAYIGPGYSAPNPGVVFKLQGL